ncbi:transcriptional regulator [Acinetobacter sp. 'aerobic (ED)']|uniref:transcriptional regulator n=1 Tax=Acinetobacter sp. 'aerobic (ED)' TaxID=174230 RepID=UPI00192BEAE7|nr:transcriptional regulator [Acinetobacter sp. 'aerobic (ED)']
MSSRLNQTDALDGGDQFVIYKGNCTDFRALPQDILLEWIKENFPSNGADCKPFVQRFNPSANFTIEVDNKPEGTYLLLNPSSAITSGTIVLPNGSEVIDQQTILFSSSRQINNLTINGNGSAVVGAPNAIAATAHFKLQYDKLSGTWNKVG